MKFEIDFVNREVPTGRPSDLDDDYCQCNERDGWTLEVEEGQATLRHSCGKQSWLLPEDIFAEVPVTVTVETCGSPGGWHGMTRCDCGPEVSIEVDFTQSP